MKKLKGPKDLSYEARLKELGNFSLEKAQGGLIILMDGNKEKGTRLFSVIHTDRTRSNEHKLINGNCI